MSVLNRVPVVTATRPPTASYRDNDPAVSASIALVLGTGDIASAIAHLLFTNGWGVAMLRDPSTPVLRRGMAFDDALEDGAAELDGVMARRASTPDQLRTLAGLRREVVLANLDPGGVAVICAVFTTMLVDARMRKYAAPADLRPLAACTIGVGPGFQAGGNVHIAIETLPGQEGGVIEQGTTATPTGEAVPLGGAGSERFIYASRAGVWQPSVPLGSQIEAGAAIGTLGGHGVLAPIAGRVRGMVRAAPGGVARGMKLLEVDPQPDARWQGLAPRAKRIAAGVGVIVHA